MNSAWNLETARLVNEAKSLGAANWLIDTQAREIDALRMKLSRRPVEVEIEFTQHPEPWEATAYRLVVSRVTEKVRLKSDDGRTFTLSPSTIQVQYT